MKRICFILQVKPDRLDEYKARHRTVWPEMQAALRETGWNNYSLFLREDGLLVGYLETEDFERARAGMAKREVNERWQREMSGFFIQPEGVLPDRAMQPLNRRGTKRFLAESRRKVWHNTGELQRARLAGPRAYAARLAELEVLTAAKVSDLLAGGPVLLRLAVAGFGVVLPPP